MDNKIEKLLSDLERIKLLISRYENPDQIPVIERDILLSVIRDLYSELMEAPVSKPEVRIQTDVPSFQPVPAATEAKSKVKIEKKPEKKETLYTRKEDEKDKVKPETIGDKLQGERQFVYETLAEKAAQQNISSKLQSKPISNINSAIGINDKFKLLRDLFNEDKESYAKTISKLDSCNNFNEAFSYISTNFNWDMEDDSVQFILDLVRRKFIVDKDE
jgi:hypothetical protein